MKPTSSQRLVRSRGLGRLPLPVSVLAVALTLAGCASDSDTPGKEATGGDPAATASADPWAVTDYVDYTGGTDGAADESLEPVTIGWLNQQGGPLGFPWATAGAKAAVKYVNEHLGGVDGHPLALSTCFIADAEAEGNACGLELVNDDDVKTVLYGTVMAGNQSFQAVNKGKKPLLMSNSISPIDAAADNVYTYNGNPGSIFGGLASYASEVVKAKSVSVIYPQDAQSTAGVGILKAALDSVDIDMKAVGFDPSTTNLTGAAVAAGVQDADLVIPLVSFPPACIAAAKALESLSVTAPVVATGSFCFTDATAQGLGGEAPLWHQLATQTNVADHSLPDVQAYLDASADVGLGAEGQGSSDASLAWGLVLTAARLLNEAGGAEADEASIAKAAKALEGPIVLGSAEIECGAYAKQPGLCGAQTRVFEHTGGGEFKALTEWLSPAGL
ncbi:ABC transporter substrate-binding protein [Nocardioides gilvus]|uniref:ABC transporter substrate-binding protein n=1 Tax=Nocardioides gilvus TaxID=1735589 RepID=UPI000D74AD2A|nr:ABC transporter substrate-binding protein [Nocardioides gilvus]